MQNRGQRLELSKASWLCLNGDTKLRNPPIWQNILRINIFIEINVSEKIIPIDRFSTQWEKEKEKEKEKEN